ncbi:MAG: type II toxin-antitoxin system VapB family antitoxin [Microthrixaceae bacterium]
MARTNIDIDDEACGLVMRRFGLSTKRDAVNFALRTVAIETLTVDQARSLRGSGWVGGLDEMRGDRAS